MKKFFINKGIAQLILLQRVELAGPILSRIRKLFGRKIFTKFISKYLIIPSWIGKKYINGMQDEYNHLSEFVNFENKSILSIGPGICGLELIINKNNFIKKLAIIEKNYISKKVVYGWDENNLEAYNNLSLVKNFLINNGISNEKFEIYDYDKKNFPKTKFDLIVSLYSLDYHYNFNLYIDYIKKVSNEDTKIIFDTIRPQYFENLFYNVKIIKTLDKTVHKSKRIICSKFKNKL
jgi:hypothetical protein